MVEERRILITGATGTIGRAVARALAQPDSAIALHCHRRVDEAQALAAELSAGDVDCHVVPADLTSAAEAIEMVEATAGALEGCDLLVHCAATFERTPFAEVTPERWRASIDANLAAPFFVAQAAARVMIKNGGPARHASRASRGEAGGAMILFSDTAARAPYPAYLPYCIAKAGVEALVQGLARVLAPAIRVNGVAPYLVTRPAGMDDATWERLVAKSPIGRAERPEEIAAVVARIAADPAVTGRIITPSEGAFA